MRDGVELDARWKLAVAREKMAKVATRLNESVALGNGSTPGASTKVPPHIANRCHGIHARAPGVYQIVYPGSAEGFEAHVDLTTR
jgi:hypothetical protein